VGSVPALSQPVFAKPCGSKKNNSPPGTEPGGLFLVSRVRLEKTSLIEVAGPSLAAVALVAGGNILEFAFGEHGFHLHFPAAGAEELLCDNVDPSVFADFCHSFSSFFLSCFFSSGFRSAIPLS
jgi:hypothetical protein